MNKLQPNYNTGVKSEDIAEYCILVGDPARAHRVAARFDTIECERSNREYITFTGTYKGTRLTVMGTGMGAASTEMAIVELTQCRPNLTLIRCGSCGSLSPQIKLGDMIISTAALRYENTSNNYADAVLPAIAHSDVFLALIRAAADSGHSFHAGLTATMPSFYIGQGRQTFPFPTRNIDIVQQLASQKVINMEMEASTLLTLAHLANHRAGVICAVYAERTTDSFIKSPAMEEAESACIEITLDAILYLREMDEEKEGHAYWRPGLKTIKTIEKELRKAG